MTETTFSIDRRGTNVPATLNINGINISIGSLGNVVTSVPVPYEVDSDGEVTFTFPFELTPDMVMTLTVGTEPSKTLLVADYYTPGLGKFEVKAWLNPGTLTGASPQKDLKIYFALGSEGFPGSASVTELQWKDLSVKEWKARLTN